MRFGFCAVAGLGLLAFPPPVRALPPEPASVSSGDRVPPPWTPMEVEGERVRCWGREHVAAGPFPDQIRSAGGPLLAGPVAFRFEGEPLPVWKGGGRTRTARSVRWSSTAARGGGILRAETVVDFDGFWRVDVSLGPGDVRGLSLEIPLDAGRARFLHYINETHYAERTTFALPDADGDGDGEAWRSRFACAVWVGDDRAGLQWVADDDAPFRLKDPQRALSVVRSGGTTTLRITLIDHPVTLEAPLNWTFGLIATPVRPPAPRGRDLRLAPGASANVHIAWWPAWTAHHASTVPKDPAALSAQTRALAARGQHLLPYVSMLMMPERDARDADGGAGWRKEPFLRMEDEGSPYWILCPNTPWAEMFPAEMEKLFRTCDVNGLYYDFVFPMPCSAGAHPCGRPDGAGGRRPSLHVFALRRMVMETYERVKAVRPDSLLLLHVSDTLLYPVLGFGDLMVVGEEKRAALARPGAGYAEVLPLEEMRAEYRGYHAGLASFLLPELATPEGMPDPARCGVPGPTEEILALALLHDVGIWPIYCHEATVERVRAAQAAFGIAEAEFAPYWEGRGPVSVADASLLVSAWVKPDAALAVVANLGGVPVRTDARFSGLARDALTGESVDGKSLEVPARGFRLIRAGR